MAGSLALCPTFLCLLWHTGMSFRVIFLPGPYPRPWSPHRVGTKYLTSIKRHSGLEKKKTMMEGMVSERKYMSCATRQWTDVIKDTYFMKLHEKEEVNTCHYRQPLHEIAWKRFSKLVDCSSNFPMSCEEITFCSGYIRLHHTISIIHTIVYDNQHFENSVKLARAADRTQQYVIFDRLGCYSFRHKRPPTSL